tara:strand:- start:131 stop:610 length:480 start_codon:yes stop_codon:yes gene_type:complete
MLNKHDFLNLTIFPHRSLSKKGFTILMCIITFICLTGGAIFWFLGAWPVFGFLGLDIILIYFAFKINYRSGEMYERFQIISQKLRILRSFPSGKMQIWELNPYWAKTEIVDINSNHKQLMIHSKDKSVSVGSFLNNYDKQKLEKKISSSLRSFRESRTI